jgi:hypothetical protein
MHTPQQDLLTVALQLIEDTAPEPTSIDDIYAAVERHVELGPEDELPPTHKGNPVADTTWRRNLRNALLAEKRAHRLVNIQHGAWGLPQPNEDLMLDSSEAWPLVVAAAKDSLWREEVLTSTVQKKRYRIARVDPSAIEVERVETGSIARLTRGEVERAIGFVNAAGARTGRRTLHYTVAKEDVLVHLHPHLDWDETGDWIVATPDGVTRAGSPEQGFETISERAPRCWALLANPARYRIEEAVRSLEEDWWTTRGKDLAPGDRIIVWKAAGRDGRRGIVAFATVIGLSEVRANSDNLFWADPSEGARMEERVPVRYEVPESLPLWVGEDHDGALKSLSVARARGGTVFHVSEGEWEAVREAAQAATGPSAPISHVAPEVTVKSLLTPRKTKDGESRTPQRRPSPTRRNANAKAVGDRAEAVVFQHLQRTLPPDQRESVRWVAAVGERPGWDLEYVGGNGELVAVEVKGTIRDQFPAVELTANEWNAAEGKGDHFHLYLVAHCMSAKPIIYVVKNPAARVQSGEFSASPSVWRLEANSGARG